jgi:hypothetical protein
MERLADYLLALVGAEVIGAAIGLVIFAVAYRYRDESEETES